MLPPDLLLALDTGRLSPFDEETETSQEELTRSDQARKGRDQIH
jgi:hypothetical protein